MSFAQFLHTQHAALIAQYFAQYFAPVNVAYIALPTLQSFQQFPGQNGGGLDYSLGFPPQDAVIWRDSQNRPELWVRPEEKASSSATGFYAKAWQQFVSIAGKTTYTPTLNGTPLAIDHLFPETAAARLGLGYVRVTAVNRRSNSLVGSTTETAAARGKTGTRRPRTATAQTIAKISGYQGSFASANNAAAVAHSLFAYLQAQGYPVPTGNQALVDLEQDLIASKLDWFRGDL
jgi:hypothetical protein